ncbi:MAG TPA: MlaD family protein [Rhodopila sp.]|nr:MlaD family protein [Rhodopila sp.]
MAAVAIVAWLALKQMVTVGPEITVMFPPSAGITAGTEVHYQSTTVGQVESAALDKDLQHVRVRIRMEAAVSGHLGPGTQFWVTEPTLTDLSTIKSIISGPTIELSPHSGAAQRDYVALAEPPLMEGLMPGRSFLLQAGNLGNVGRGSAVMFHGLNVGSVQTTKLLADRTLQARVFVEAPYDRLVQPDSKFWSSGTVQFAVGASGPHLQMPSIGSLLTGAVAFDSPNSPESDEADAEHVFTLYGSPAAAEFSLDKNAVAYRTVFGADAGALADGAPVMLAGKQVGSVQQTTLRYDAKTGTLIQPVTLWIEPARLGLDGAGGRAAMDRVMARLVAQGLRAQPGSVIPLVGPTDVELTFVGDAPAASLAGMPPELPVAPGNGGIAGIVTALDRISNKLDTLPLAQIADNIHVATAQLAALSQSPALMQTLQGLDRSVANLERTSASVRADVPELLVTLRETARQTESTVGEAKRTVATLSGDGPVGLNADSLSQTLYELTRAAQSMRELADYLDRNPSALLRGRQ